MLKRRGKGCFGAVRSLIERRANDIHTALHAHFRLPRIEIICFISISRIVKTVNKREQKSSERNVTNEYNAAFVGDYNDHSLRISPMRMQTCIEGAKTEVSFLYRLRRYSIIRRKRTF